MSVVHIYPSNLSYKKWVADFGKHRIHFGATGYEDYTMHQDEKRKERYIARHKKGENWSNIYSPGFWSRWFLWNKPSVKEAVKDIETRFGLKVILSRPTD
jgi:hypothetical protein